MTKKKQQKKALFFAGLILVAVAFLLEALIISKRYDWMWTWYTDLRKILMDLEDRITNLDRSFEFVLAIMALFIIKAFFPIYTTSTVCLITGIVFPLYAAIPINMVGLGIQFTIKYFWGRHFGAGYAWKLLQKNDSMRSVIQHGGKGNPAVLFALRMVPAVPANLVSSIYGSFDFGYWKFMAISLLGFSPKLISSTIAGTNMFDPLSIGFLLPVMLICLVTGISCLSANGVWNLVDRFAKSYDKRRKERELKKAGSQEENADADEINKTNEVNHASEITEQTPKEN